jgi:hypothetical protein
LYYLQGGQITLGFLYDQTNQMVLQTEAVVDAQIPLDTMRGLLENMIQVPLSGDLDASLSSVASQPDAQQFSFTVDNLKGIVGRSPEGKITLATWDPVLEAASEPTLPPPPTPLPTTQIIPVPPVQSAPIQIHPSQGRGKIETLVEKARDNKKN